MVKGATGSAMNVRTLLCCLLLAAMLLGCGKPVPPEKADFVGEWKAPGMHLLLLQDGSVQYNRIKSGVTTSVSGPLQGFEGDNFVVGVGLWRTTFVVSKPPYRDGAVWKMVVDGVELTRSN
jgi:hypothetical protein